LERYLCIFLFMSGHQQGPSVGNPNPLRFFKMIIESLDQALALPKGRFYLQHAFCDLEGVINEQNLTRAVQKLRFPLEATCQGQVIAEAYNLDNPSSCKWELPEETP